MALLLLLLLLLSPATTAAAAAAAAAAKPSAYEVLESYGFPPGILPKGASSYTLNSTNGDFTAHLAASDSGTCEFSIRGSYSLRYQPTISGRIAPGRLTNLQGVAVKVLFFWLNIVEVTRRDDQLEFSVGIVSADFGVENFAESPTCGCGFDCVNGGIEEGVRLRWAF